MLGTGEHQASALERLLARRRAERLRPDRAGTDSRVLVIASGKGGVGKTNVAVNLAVALNQRGRRAMVVDADLGLGNVEALCGLHCAYNLGDFLAGRSDLASIVEEGPAGIWCAAGGTALSDVRAFDRAALRRLLAGLLALPQRPAYVIFDLPAGLGEGVRACLAAAGDVFLVTTPEPTALADAYAVIKATFRVNPTVRLHVIVNQALSRSEGRRAFQRLRTTASRFLGLRLAAAAVIPADAAVKRAVREQVPFVLGSPLTAASRAVRCLALRIERQRTVGQPAASFFYRLSTNTAEGGSNTWHAPVFPT